MTTTPRTVRRRDVPPQRWRNGGGTTRELLAMPPGDAWHVRVSVADVEADGPFSVFPGVERWFAVVDGSGVLLDVDGAVHRLAPGSRALRFDGGAVTACRLIDGATRDLNLMLRGVDGRLDTVVDDLAWTPPAGRAGLYARAPGRCDADGKAYTLDAHTLLWFDAAPARLSYRRATVPAAADASMPAGWWLWAAEEATA